MIVVTAERDTTRQRGEQAIALVDSLQIVAASTLPGDMMREVTRATREADFYRTRYHDAIPPERRESYTRSRSTHSHTRTTSRGVTQPLPTGGPSGTGGASPSGAGGTSPKPAPSEDSTT